MFGESYVTSSDKSPVEKLRPLLRVGMSSIAIATLLHAGAAHAGTERASRNTTGALNSPAEAWATYGTATQRTDTIPSTWRNSDEIVALARGFGSEETSITNDEYAARVLKSLRSNIETEFRFELGKGGRMAWVDQSGTAFDQAELMDALLEKKGISSEVVVGTITLDAQAFGRWTGLVHSVNEAAQTFSVEARAACELLAAGGIPATVNGSATCSSLTGALTTVTMGHVWVRAGGKSYDPAFKTRKFYQGNDIATAAGCGTENSSTCGTQVTTSAMTGATQSTFAGSPSIQNVNQASLASSMNSLALGIENTIKASAPEATMIEFVGGSSIAVDQVATASATLSYQTTVERTFLSEVPDQYRVRLRFRHKTMDANFFLDELDVGGLVWDGTSLLLRGTAIASAPTCSGSTPPSACNQYGSDWLLNINHQFVDTALGDEYIRQYTFPLGSFTVQVSAGEVAQSRSFYAEQFSKQLNKLQSQVPYYFIQSRSVGKVTSNASTLSDILAKQSLATTGFRNALNLVVTRHHRVLSIESPGAGPVNISGTGNTSIIPSQFSDARRMAAFQALNAIDTVAEGDISNLMLRFSVPSLSKWSNQSGIRFVRVAPSGVATVINQLTNYQASNTAGLQWAGANGFTTILPVNGLPPCKSSLTWDGQTTTACPKAKDAPSFVFSNSGGAHLLGAQYKGTDYFNSPEPADEEEDFSLTQAKYLSLDSGSGTFVMKPGADISTGVGEFPASLSFSRSYDSSTRQYETFRQHDANFTVPQWLNYYNAPGGNYMENVAQVGGGWSHNFQNIAYIGTDPSLSFGQTSALHSSAYLAALLVLRDQFATGTFQSNLSSIFVMDWLEEQMFQKAVTVELQGGGGEKFLRLPSGQYAGAPYSGAKITVGGAYVGPRPLRSLGKGQYGYTNLSIVYEPSSGDRLTFGESSTFFHGTNAFLTEWRASSGVRARMNWADQPGETYNFYDYKGEPGYLTAISNSLGRSLTFNSTQLTPLPPPPTTSSEVDNRRLLNSVTDENGRSVSFTKANCGLSPLGFFNAPLSILCNRLDVSLPDQRMIRYSYEPGVDSPDHDPILYAPTALRRIYTGQDLQNAFQTLRFDELYRVRETKDGTGIATKLFPGAVGGERFKDGLSIDSLGNRTSVSFDQNNRITSQTDPLGRITRNDYNEAGQLLREITADGLASEYTYDVRGNKLTDCKIARGRVNWTTVTDRKVARCDAAQGDLVTRTFYVGGPTVQPEQCTSMLTCNRPAYQIDPRGFRTEYTWSEVHGGILSMRAGLDSSGTCVMSGGICPETTYQYTPFTGADAATFYLPTAVVEKINATASLTTSFEYDPAKKFVLKSKIESDGTQSLRTCYTYDAVGNAISETKPLGTGATCP